MRSQSETRSFRRTVLLYQLSALLLIPGSRARAQVDTGAILGTVTDQSGAVIPSAKVTLTNEGTAFTISTASRQDGSFMFIPVKIGLYTLAAESQGFQRSIRPHVAVDVQERVVVDLTLVPGAVTQTIKVNAVPPLLQVHDASVGQVVSARAINDLPLNGRNFIFLARLSAGVTFGQEDVRGENAHGRFSANGTRPTQNNYLLDGMDNNTQISSIQNGKDFAVLPPIDAIAEFKVQTNNYSAEFGRGGGAVMNASMKSGTNQIHGSAWEFFRNDKLDAADFFLNAASKSKGEFRQNQFGFALGGPVMLPKIYDGKNKTFFFADYEGLRIRQDNPFVSTVPTLAERNSGYTDFSDLIAEQSGTRSDLLGRAIPSGTILDPATTRSVTGGQVDPVTGLVASANGFVRDPFAGNMILASRLDPHAVKILQLLPEPNGPGVFSNYTSDPVFQQNVNTFDTRVDQNFSELNQLFVRYSLYNIGRVRPGPFPGLADGSNSLKDASLTDHSQNVVLSETHTFSPSLLNELRVGYSREHVVFLQPFGNVLGIPQQFGIQGIVQRPENGGLPTFNVGSLSRFGSFGYLPSDKWSNTLQLADDLTHTVKSHTLKAGVLYQHLNFPTAQPQHSRGQIQFPGAYTSVVDHVDPTTGIAQLLLTPTPATVPNGINNVGGANAVFLSGFHPDDFSQNYFGTYFQDNVKVTRQLTLNLGVRWEYFSPTEDNFGDQANLIPGAPFKGAIFLIPNSRKDIVPQSFVAALAMDGISLQATDNLGVAITQRTNFAPRFGLAYQVSPKFVLRGGYGIFYGGLENTGAWWPATNFPFKFQVSRFSPNNVLPMTPDNSIGLLETSFLNLSLSPNTVNPLGLYLGGVQYHWQTPYTQDYNLTTQYQLTPNSSVTLAYVGSTSRHMPMIPGLNQVSEILPPDLNPQDFVPFPDFGWGAPYTTSEGTANYNSLQVSLERRFSKGFYFLGNYTWSKVRTDANDPLEGDFVQPPRAPYIAGVGSKADYHLADFDVRQILHLSGGYDLPFGPGKHFMGSSSGVMGQFVGGWNLNWILTLQDGQPLTVMCTNTTAAGINGCYALLVPGQNRIGGKHNVDQWMNPAAFANPPAATTIGQTDLSPLGGAPTQVVGPGFHRLDFSLFKQFKTSETTRLEFRAEFLNLTNHPNFGLLTMDRDFTNPTNFGRISSTRDSPNDPREIQFALKFYW